MKVILLHSPRKDKRYRVEFYENGKKINHTDFGDPDRDNYTIHRDENRKNQFLSRFRALIKKHKNDPTKPITLSHMILWNKPSLKASWNDYKKHFKFDKG
jgi:hypothetical protein